MHKLIDDTLKTAKGKWDKQALTFFLFAIITSASGIALIVLSYALSVMNNPTAENVFITFAGLTGALSGVNIWNKKVNRKTERFNEEEEYDQAPS